MNKLKQLEEQEQLIQDSKELIEGIKNCENCGSFKIVNFEREVFVCGIFKRILGKAQHIQWKEYSEKDVYCSLYERKLNNENIED